MQLVEAQAARRKHNLQGRENSCTFSRRTTAQTMSWWVDLKEAMTARFDVTRRVALGSILLLLREDSGLGGYVH
jgi:hypothetical protein